MLSWAQIFIKILNVNIKTIKVFHFDTFWSYLV